ncbi:manganese/zinc/iron transport system permease protein [Alkalibacterium subtropicum]|uniref:Manganese/zinc/iron transport system permease protein n=1 Tax=Alkalibacterium subtropicum TaxID=753702 RepID=A0A1I1FGK6_9LACT|nr:metal ABC transporter permease [Alkalibacterium subtropicum]SFB98434.1 manganese/zinc/iron transport system permease protein [Alkalibacterium subtropicum]
MSMITEITMIAVVVAIACALPGVFLVLRGVTMVSDAITHTVLLGIVLAFFITQDLNSPLLMIGATLVGVATVWLIETIQRSDLVSNDAAIGIVFPLFFSIAIILITLYAGDVHLDEDAVLMGDLAFAPFRRFDAFGYDLGPQSLWVMSVILVINALFIFFFYKELKITTFDPAFAAALGFTPLIIHYALMTLVSLTAVGAYDSVGSILIVGFMVGPALSGYLLTHSLKKMISITVLMAVINSISGVQLAFLFDTTIAGMIAVVTGGTTLLILVFSPGKGLFKQQLNQKRAHNNLNKRIETLI